jgi:hypothetical protein
LALIDKNESSFAKEKKTNKTKQKKPWCYGGLTESL